jgi:L-lactate dehydrogenase complex protein LldG
VSAREEILARVRAATSAAQTATATSVTSVTAPVVVPDEGTPEAHGPTDSEHLVALFAETVADYRAEVRTAAPPDVGGAIAAALQSHACTSVVVPAGLPEAWTGAVTAVAEVVTDTTSTSAAKLDAVDAVVTAAAFGIATTGTIVLDHGPDQGRRAISLVPDVHVCVVRADQVVHDVPDAVHLLRPAVDAKPPAPLTWVSGPSATSDIELERVEGVHGPRTLVVVLVTDEVGP